MDQAQLVDNYKQVFFILLLTIISSCIPSNKEHKSHTISDSTSYNKSFLKDVKKRTNTFRKVALPSLVGETIKCTLTSDCINFYEFEDENNYKYWSCEHQELTNGSYQIIDSALILTEQRIIGNIELREELIKLTMIFSGDFFVLEKREVLDKEKWVTTYERSKRTRTHGKECKYYSNGNGLGK